MATLTWDNNLINLRDILADLYWEKSESYRIVQQAGMNPTFITFKDSPINNWHFILDYARQDAASVDAIIDVVIGEQPPAKKDGSGDGQRAHAQPARDGHHEGCGLETSAGLCTA